MFPAASVPYAPDCKALSVSAPGATSTMLPAASVAYAPDCNASRVSVPVPTASTPASTPDPSSPRFIASPAAAPKPAVNPLIKPRFRSPVTAAVPIPVRAPVINGLSLRRLPRPPKRRGRNASGWPVTGLVVSRPVGDIAAIPATSTGFMCTSIESP